YPALHTGRPWYDYWLFPYPNTMSLWPQFRSPLMWDVFAVSTYATVSALFWYVGLIPDLATLRDRSTNMIARKIYGMGALGWRGSAKHWYRYESAYLLLAGLSTPLVLSVHTIVSFDFAVAQLPGWHATFFPPYWKMYVALIVCNGLAPQMMWVKRFRTSTAMLFITAMFVNVGMWLERFVIIPGSLHRDFLPSSWGMYHGTRWDWSMFIGSMGLFLFLLFLFIRFLPMISIFEMRTLVPQSHGSEFSE